MRKPLIDADGLVVNIIEYDPELSAGYTPPDGLTLQPEHPDAIIGSTRNPDGTYTAPQPPPEPAPTDTDRVAAALQLIDEGADPGQIRAALEATDHAQLDAARDAITPVDGGKIGRN